MRLIKFLIIALLASIVTNAQIVQPYRYDDNSFTKNVNIGSGTARVTAASAYLEVGPTSGANRGALLPRLNTTQQNSITLPATGLIIYNTDSSTFCYYNGTSWKKFATHSEILGPTGWDDMLAVSQAQTANRTVDLDGNNFSLASGKEIGLGADSFSIAINNILGRFKITGLKKNVGNYALRISSDGHLSFADTTTGGGGGGTQTIDQTLGYGNQTSKELVLGDQDSLGARFSYNFKQSPFATWIKIGSTTLASGSVSGTTFSGGSSWSDYILANPYYLSSENWSMTTGKFVMVTATDTTKGFAIGINGSPGAILANFHLADSTGYISLHYQASQNPVITTNKDIERFNRAAGDTLQTWLVRRGQLITATIKNFRTGQIMSLSYKYKLSYPTSYVSPKAGLAHIFFFGGQYKFIENFDFRANETKRPKVLFLTTSIGAGLNANDQLGSWPYIAMQGTRGDFSVHGAPGETMNGALLYIDEIRSYYKPNHVVIEMTTNSLNGFTSATSFAHDLDSFCRRMADSSITVSIVNCIPQLVNGATYNDSITAIAGRYSAVVYDATALLKRTGGTSMDAKYAAPDSTHMNPYGHLVLGQMTHEKMLQNGIIDTVSQQKLIGLAYDNSAPYMLGQGAKGSTVLMAPPANIGNTDLTSPDDRTLTVSDKKFTVSGFTGIIFKSSSTGVFADPGAGNFMFFNASRKAFRAGYFTGSYNNPDSLGLYSGGVGTNLNGVGDGSWTTGNGGNNRGANTLMSGTNNTLTSAAHDAVAAGSSIFGVGPYGAGFGYNNKFDAYSIISGSNGEALNGNCWNFGHDNKANGNTSGTQGHHLTAVGNGTIMLGSYADDNGGFVSTFIGDNENDLFTFDQHKRLYLRQKNGMRLLLSTSLDAFDVNGNGQFRIGNNTVDASAMLEVQSTTRGFLPPKMTTTQRTSISSPAEGLCVYDTTLHKLYVYDGTTWQAAW